MPIRQGLSGIRATTKNNLLVDAGILYGNLSLAALRGSSEAPFDDAISGEDVVIFGATRGGQGYNLNKSNRQIDVNGRRLPIMCFNRIDDMIPTLTVTIIEHDVDSQKAYLGAADVDVWTSYTEITPRIEINENDYFENIALACTLSGSGLPALIVIEYALAVSVQEITLEDKNEAAVQVSFVGHALPSNPSEVPAHTFIPNDVATS